MTKYPNYLDGNTLLHHFSYLLIVISNLGEITPHLFILPINSTTTF